MHGNIAPMALTLSHERFNDKDWQFEIKWDGFRMLASFLLMINCQWKMNYFFDQFFLVFPRTNFYLMEGNLLEKKFYR